MQFMQLRQLLDKTLAKTFTEAAGARPELTAGWIHRQFERTDDRAGGALQTLRRRLKFWCRCIWNSSALRTSLGSFNSPALSSVVAHEPTTQVRPLRSYLRRGLTAPQRALAVKAHFNWLSATLPEPVIAQLYGAGPRALLDAGSPVNNLGLSLSRAAGLGREGELALNLEWKGVRVMSLAFSVLDAALVMPAQDHANAGSLRGRRAVVGALQGTRGADIALRELSAACQRIRPSALLMVGLQAVSEAAGLQAPLCVATRSHVYASYMSLRRKANLDYDAAWREASAEQAGSHYWLLPARPLLRPDSEVESHRRAQHRRRNALRQDFFRAAADGMTRALDDRPA